MPKVTFPHMGNLKIPARAFFDEIGLDVVLPPDTSRKTLDLGVKYSPEFACLPLKINLGNFIEALDRGAEYIIMGGGMGPCRFGYYGEVQQEILKELGYDFEMITLENNLLLTAGRVKKLITGFPLRKISQAAKICWAKLKAVDNIDVLVLEARAREKIKGQIDDLYREFLQKIDQTMSVDKTREVQQHYTEMIEDATRDFQGEQPVKIGIVGEIYVVLESYTNLYTARKLNSLGAVVQKEVSISHWLLDFLGLNQERKKIRQAGKPYINHFVGGHGQDSVGNSVIYARNNLDGIVHIAPFTCMPEIVAQSILKEVSQQEDIQILSLVFDEHTAEAGLMTRLEAFVDLLSRKKSSLHKQIK